MVTAIVAYLDSLSLNTLFGRIEKWIEENVEKNTPTGKSYEHNW